MKADVNDIAERQGFAENSSRFLRKDMYFIFMILLVTLSFLIIISFTHVSYASKCCYFINSFNQITPGVGCCGWDFTDYPVDCPQGTPSGFSCYSVDDKYSTIYAVDVDQSCRFDSDCCDTLNGEKKCGDYCYDPKSESCCGGEIDYTCAETDCECCGDVAYDPDSQECCDASSGVVGKACCGTQAYDSDTQKCCNGVINNIPLSDDPSNYLCCDTVAYNPLTQICCANKVYDRDKYGCCDDITAYKKADYFCCNDGNGNVAKYGEEQCCSDGVYDMNDFNHCGSCDNDCQDYVDDADPACSYDCKYGDCIATLPRCTNTPQYPCCGTSGQICTSCTVGMHTCADSNLDVVYKVTACFKKKCPDELNPFKGYYSVSVSQDINCKNVADGDPCAYKQCSYTGSYTSAEDWCRGTTKYLSGCITPDNDGFEGSHSYYCDGSSKNEVESGDGNEDICSCMGGSYKQGICCGEKDASGTITDGDDEVHVCVDNVVYECDADSASWVEVENCNTEVSSDCDGPNDYEKASWAVDYIGCTNGVVSAQNACDWGRATYCNNRNDDYKDECINERTLKEYYVLADDNDGTITSKEIDCSALFRQSGTSNACGYPSCDGGACTGTLKPVDAGCYDDNYFYNKYGGYLPKKVYCNGVSTSPADGDASEAACNCYGGEYLNGMCCGEPNDEHDGTITCDGSLVKKCNSNTKKWETIEDCSATPYADCDSGKDYFTASKVQEITGCDASSKSYCGGTTYCSFTEYSDYCQDDNVVEYYLSADRTYTTYTENCSSYDTCISDDEFKDFTCYGGACTSTFHSVRDGKYFCEGCGHSYCSIEGECCYHGSGDFLCKNGADDCWYCSNGVKVTDPDANKDVCEECNGGIYIGGQCCYGTASFYNSQGACCYGSDATNSPDACKEACLFNGGAWDGSNCCETDEEYSLSTDACCSGTFGDCDTLAQTCSAACDCADGTWSDTANKCCITGTSFCDLDSIRYCDNGTFTSQPDDSKEACECLAPYATWIDTNGGECCGDDRNEYTITASDGTKGCCGQPTDCFDGKNCINNGDFDPGFGYCDNGAFKECLVDEDCSTGNPCDSYKCNNGECEITEQGNCGIVGSGCEITTDAYCNSCNHEGDGRCNCGENPTVVDTTDGAYNDCCLCAYYGYTTNKCSLECSGSKIVYKDECGLEVSVYEDCDGGDSCKAYSCDDTGITPTCSYTLITDTPACCESNGGNWCGTSCYLEDGCCDGDVWYDKGDSVGEDQICCGGDNIAECCEDSDCNDGNSCTIDTCNSGTCEYTLTQDCCLAGQTFCGGQCYGDIGCCNDDNWYSIDDPSYCDKCVSCGDGYVNCGEDCDGNTKTDSECVGPKNVTFKVSCDWNCFWDYDYTESDIISSVCSVTCGADDPNSCKPNEEYDSSSCECVAVAEDCSTPEDDDGDGKVNCEDPDCFTGSCPECYTVGWDGNTCTCLPVAEGTPCDDGHACTENDVCTTILYGSYFGCYGTPKSCDDGDSCTYDACFESESYVGGYSCSNVVDCTKEGCECHDGCYYCGDGTCNVDCGEDYTNCNIENTYLHEGVEVSGDCVAPHYECDDLELYYVEQDGSTTFVDDCDDGNSCTKDSCDATNGKCINTLKCDGTTCSISSVDYCSSCASCGNGVCDCGESLSTCQQDCCDDNKTVSSYCNGITLVNQTECGNLQEFTCNDNNPDTYDTCSCATGTCQCVYSDYSTNCNDIGGEPCDSPDDCFSGWCCDGTKMRIESYICSEGKCVLSSSGNEFDCSSLNGWYGGGDLSACADFNDPLAYDYTYTCGKVEGEVKCVVEIGRASCRERV